MSRSQDSAPNRMDLDKSVYFPPKEFERADTEVFLRDTAVTPLDAEGNPLPLPDPEEDLPEESTMGVGEKRVDAVFEAASAELTTRQADPEKIERQIADLEQQGLSPRKEYNDAGELIGWSIQNTALPGSAID